MCWSVGGLSEGVSGLFVFLQWLKDTDVASQIAAAGGIWTKGLATTFGSSQNDAKILNDVQGGLEVNIAELPGDHLLLQ